jgi:hypothetical protein
MGLRAIVRSSSFNLRSAAGAFRPGRATQLGLDVVGSGFFAMGGAGAKALDPQDKS